VCLVGKAAGNGDSREGFLAFEDYLLGPVDAAADDEGMRRLPEGLLETPTEVAAAQPRDTCEFGEGQGPVEIGLDVNRDALCLPRRETGPPPGAHCDQPPAGSAGL
jgi:hypothetical protein